MSQVLHWWLLYCCLLTLTLMLIVCDLDLFVFWYTSSFAFSYCSLQPLALRRSIDRFLWFVRLIGNLSFDFLLDLYSVTWIPIIILNITIRLSPSLHKYTKHKWVKDAMWIYSNERVRKNEQFKSIEDIWYEIWKCLPCSAPPNGNF
jgi:hypothetical protein